MEENTARYIDKGLFEGYVEIREKADNKRGYIIKHVYVGDYYEFPFEGRDMLRRKRLFNIPVVLCIFALLFGYMQSGALGSWYTIAGGVIVAALVIGTVSVISVYSTSPHTMMIVEYKAGPKRLAGITRIGVIGCAVGALTQIISAICGTGRIGLYVAVMDLICGGVMYFINRTESATEYIIVENENKKEDYIK